MRIQSILAGFCLLAAAATASAQDYSYHAYVDNDANPGTGCDVVYPGGTVTGAERRLTAEVTGTNVTAVTMAECASGTFAAPTAINGGGYPVGLNIGVSGSDVIEWSATPVQLDAARTASVRLQLVGESAGGASDVLLTTTGLPGGPSIILGLPFAIPAIGSIGLLLMVAGLLWFGARRARRVGLAGLGALLFAGSVWAANFATDGAIGDWIGESPRAVDANGDASLPDDGADVLQFFAEEENGAIFFRADVVDIENQRPVAAGQTLTYLEDAAAQTITLTATDSDGDPLTFAIVTPPTLGTLSAITQLTPTSASVNYTPNPNANGADSFTFSANDGQSTSLPATVSITLTPVNDVPSFTSGGNVSAVKDSGPQTISPWATAISAGPADEAGQTLVFNITNNTNAALFSVQPSVSPTGVLTFTNTPNANGTATITLNIQDNGGVANGGVDTSATQTFDITLTAVNDAPSFTAGANQTVNEDAGAQTVNPWATAISAGPPDEAGQTLTFNITNNTNAALFSAGPAVSPTGVLTYTPAANANGVATITLALQDNGGVANGGVDTSPPQTFTITVTAVNDVPSFTSGGNVSVVKDTGPQTISPWATAISAGPPDEAGQTLVFNITNNTNAALFSVQPSVSPTGVLTFTNTPNANGTATITLNIQDNGGVANGGVDTSATQTFDITLTAVNDAPSFTAGANQTVNEDAGAQTVNPWATAISAGPPDEAGQTLTFNITNNTNAALFSAGPAVSPTGVLTYTPAANANGVATITLALQDNGGVVNGGVDTSPTQTFTITVTAVNDAPSFTAANPPAVGEDAGPQTPTVATAISAGPPDESAQTLAFTITNNTNAALFSGTPTISPAGVLSYTPAANTSGTAILTFQLADNGGIANGGVDTSATQTITVTVNAINDVPSFTAGPNQGVNEDAGAQTVNPWATAISAGPPDESGQTLAFNITNNTNAALFSAGPAISATGVLTYTPAANANGAATITLSIQDNGGTAGGGVDTSATQTFTITVTAVNDEPSFTAANPPAVGEDAGPQTPTVATAISAGPPDEAAQTLAFAITNNSNAGLFNGTPTISPAGVLSYTPAANTTGTAILTFQLQDNGGIANGGDDTSPTQTITVTVNSVNDAPSFTAGPNQSVAEDSGAQTANPWATAISAGPPDEAGQTLTFNVTGNTNPALFSAGPAVSPTGVLTYTPAANAVGVATITLTLQDNGGVAGGGVDTSAAQTFTITVTAVNDAPVNTVPLAQSVGTGATLAFTGPNSISIVDIDAAAGNVTTTVSTTIGTLSASAVNGAVVTGSGSASVSITDVLGDVNATLQTLTFSSAASGTGTITVLTSDLGNTGTPGALTDSDSFAVTVDSPPTVTATTPINGATVPNNQALSITFSENITTTGSAVTLTCGAGNLITGGSTGTNVGSLTPTYTGSLPAGNCVLTVVAANVTDSDVIDPPNQMVADFVVNFSVDAAPSVSTLTPANGATNQSSTVPVVVTFSEPVTTNGSSFTVECPVATPAAFTVSGGPTTYTLTPNTSWPGGVTCTVTVVAAQVDDVDTFDPPGTMVANFVSTFATDAAPTVTGGTPLDLATNVATSTNVTFVFSENVDDLGGAITLNCAGVIAGAITGSGTNTLTFDPTADLPAGTLCTATAVAVGVGDTDVNDPPNNLAADVVRTFTTDAPPSVLTTVPINGATDQPATGNITVNFSESVNFDTTANAGNVSFDLECPSGTPVNFTVVTASPAASVALNPDDNSIAGQTCTLTVLASGITDQDAGDPPDTMLANFVASFTFAGVANDDAYPVTRHLTLSAPAAAETDANDILGAGVITGFGTTIGTANGTAAGATIDDGANGTLTLNANGSFTFLPPVNPVAATTDFFYTVTGGDTASITFTYQSELVWFVDDNATGTTCTGDNAGTQACPLTTLTAAAGAHTTNDTIFVLPGNQTATVTLLVGARLIGDGASGSLATHSGVTPVLGSAFAAFSGVAPVISCAGNCITVPATGNNFLRGFTVGASGATGTDITGNNFGTLTIDEVLLNGNGRALNLTTGTIAGAGFTGVTSSASSTQGVNLAGLAGVLNMGSTTISGNTTQGILVGTTTGNVNFGNTSVTGGGGTDAISLQNNSAGTRTFGTVTISGNAGAGILHGAGGGTTTVTGATTITNPTGTGVDIQNSVSAITFDAVTVDKGASAGTGINIATSGTGSVTAASLIITTNNGAGLVANAAGTLTIGGTGNTITSTGGAALDITNTTLGGGATFSTVSSTGSAGKGINIDTVTNALTMNGGAIGTPTGIAFDLNAGSSNVTYAGTITSTAAARLIEVTARTGGTTLFSGNLSGTGGTHTGINIANNTGGTVNLTGATKTLNTGANAAVTLATNAGSNINFIGGNLDIDTTSGTGFNATGGALGISVQGTNNTILTTTGTALNVNATVAGTGLTFQSINSATASANQVISLTNTGAGPVTVSGTGAAGSGGTIDNKTDDAIRLNNTGGQITLDRMIIEDIGDMAGASNTNSTHDAIHGQDVNGGLSMTGTTIRRVSDQAIHGATLAGGAATVWNGLVLEGVVIEDSNRFHVAGVGDANNEGTIRILGLRGAVTINNSTFLRGGEFLDTFVTGGTMNMVVTNSSFTNAYKEFTVGALASVGGHCIDVVVQGAGAANVTIGNRAAGPNSNIFLNCRLGSVRFVNDTGSTGNSDLIVARNTFTVNDGSSGIGGDFDFPMGGVLAWNLGNGPGGSVVDTIIENNVFTDVTNASGGVGQLTLIAEGGLLQALVQNNSFVRPGNAPWFIQSRNTANSNARVRFANNSVTGGPSLCTADPSCAGGYSTPGLRTLFDANTGATLDATLDTNSFAGHDQGFDPGQTVEFRGLAPGGGNFCVDMTSNQADDGYSLEPLAGTMRTVGAGTCPVGSPSAACQTLMGNRNNRGGGNSLITNPPLVNVFNTAVTVSGVACAIPVGGPF